MKNYITEQIKKEILLCRDPSFEVGSYLYMGMAKLEGTTVCISIGYKIDYCLKKAIHFDLLSQENLVFYKINKVKTGELTACENFIIPI